MTDAPDRIWVKDGKAIEWRGAMDKDGHDPRVSGCVLHLKATPAREHAEELVAALRNVEDDYCDAAGGRTDMHCAWLKEVRDLLSKIK